MGRRPPRRRPPWRQLSAPPPRPEPYDLERDTAESDQRALEAYYELDAPAIEAGLAAAPSGPYCVNATLWVDLRRLAAESFPVDPIVDPAIPYPVRRDAWLWRTEQLLAHRPGGP